MKKINRNNILFVIVVGIVLVISYFFWLIPIESFLEAKVMYMDKISQALNTSLLILLSFILSFLDWEKVPKRKLFYFLFLLFAVFGVIILFSQRKNLREKDLPKIYKIYPTSGIQLVQVTLTGKNFGQNWEQGKIFFDGEEVFGILSWDQKKIIFEVPVPKRFGEVAVFIKNSKGVESNKLPFEVKNPDIYK